MLRALASALLMMVCHSSLAIGWHTITPQNLEKSSIELTISYDAYGACHEVKVTLPDVFDFGDLGKRPFESLRLKQVEVKERGWQLTGKGSRMALETRKLNSRFEPSRLCLSAYDITYSHLEVWYKTVQGQPPMLVIIELDEFI
ncbi:hypothetical protein QWI17_13530 [Gilvimarinus sp. SDUM040013]|uniref:Uncharacterized protein n=1 Tax=Gilvimarinus gilvus TaxID=3058038 RepID=A0ABU4RVM8_9GAMM|nr:hypothetical protein [Gilvimarinus sp. SDUM040013]MDO3386863.1 hypothetical protein [Gilvimarinus sp. SDUM040013]MDX6848207.1 hypothetical protein [Gilvimarinus sp. SDUM040013]